MDGIRALVFDVFGTVVDWRSTIIREGRELGRQKGLDVDWAKFADTWRAGYAPAMNRVRTGQLPWTPLDRLHRMILDGLLEDFHITGMSEDDKEHLNRVWHRLDPWPDSVEGLRRLKNRFVIATLSNGNMALLVNMAKYSGLPWDCVLSAELARHFKPDAEVYRMAAVLLDLLPEQLLMVAAHESDLRAAHEVGLRTAFVARPLEYGPNGTADKGTGSRFDLTATSFIDLAEELEI